MLWAPSAGSGCGLFRVIDRCWMGDVDELCGNADEFEDDVDADGTAFDLNEASIEAKSLIFIA